VIRGSKLGRGKVTNDVAHGTSAKWSREWVFFAIVVTVWCMEPLARRLLDWASGAFNPIQIMSLVPFLITMAFAFLCFRREHLKRVSPALKILGSIWVATFTLGLFIAFFRGSVSAGMYEFIEYVVPMLAGFWLAGQDLDAAEIMRRTALIVLPLGAVVAIYGLIQFVQPSPWDALWVLGSGFQDSVGSPEPFTMRVFSTLPSPGPAADFLTFTILLALPYLRIKTIWMWPLVGLLSAALLLTLVREAWVGLVVGLVVFLALSPSRFRSLPFIIICGAIALSLVSSLPTLLGGVAQGDVLSSRIATLGDVNHDTSAIARQGEIQDALEQSVENPVGSGLGSFGAASKLSNPSDPIGNVMDSGYMARLLELGWVGFAGYLFVLVGSFLVLAWASLSNRLNLRITQNAQVAAAGSAAIAAALLWSDAAGDAHIGLDGFVFWIALGIGLRTVGASSAATAPAVRGVLRRRQRSATA
jgi:putative inorganic carbon (hco3(-)) transporter